MRKAIEKRTKPRTPKPRVIRDKAAAYKPARPSLTRAEQRALAEFRARLHEILPNSELKSLILYGSKARGESHPGSDVDLFIVHDAPRKEIRDEISDALSEIQQEWFEQKNIVLAIRPIVRTAKELNEESATGDPLLQNIGREGIILEGEPIMPEEMDRKYHSATHIEDARKTLQWARTILSDGDVRLPIAMAFSIYEDAMRALLIAKGIVPKSHEGTKTLFGIHIVKKGLVPKKFGHHYQPMLDDRNDVTYAKQKQYTAEDAESALERAEELLTVAGNLIPKFLQEEPWNYLD